jgi:hypothetical protein
MILRKREARPHTGRDCGTVVRQDSKMDGSEMLRKPVVINTVLSPEDRK